MDFAEFKNKNRMEKESQEIWWQDAQNVFHKQDYASVASLDVSSGFVDVTSAIIDIIYVFILLIGHLLGDLLDNQ